MTCRQPGNMFWFIDDECNKLMECEMCSFVDFWQRHTFIFNKLNFRQRNVKLLLPMMTTVGNEMIELKLFFFHRWEYMGQQDDNKAS